MWISLSSINCFIDTNWYLLLVNWLKIESRRSKWKIKAKITPHLICYLSGEFFFLLIRSAISIHQSWWICTKKPINVKVKYCVTLQMLFGWKISVEYPLNMTYVRINGLWMRKMRHISRLLWLLKCFEIFRWFRLLL